MSILSFGTVAGGDLAAKAIMAIATVSIIRWLSPAELADHVYLTSLVILASTLLSGFFNRHYIIVCSVPATARHYQRWQVTTSTSAYILLWLSLARDRDMAAALSGAACTWAISCYEFARTHAQKGGAFRRYALADIVRSVLFVSAVLVVLIVKPTNIVAYLIAAQALAYAIAWWLFPSLPPKEASKESLTFTTLIADKHSLHLLVYFALLGLFGQLPILILERTASPAEFAEYGSAMRYYGLALSIVVAANVILLPKIAVAATFDELRDKYLESRPLLFYAMLAIVIIAAVGYLAIPWIDGSKYSDAPILFLILSSALLPGVCVAPLFAVYARMRWTFDLAVSLVIANVVCASIGVTSLAWGSIASAVSLPAAVLSQLLYLLWVLSRRRKTVIG